MLPNRIAVYLTALAGLATALAPVVADLDITSTAGLVGGFAGIATVVSVWLNGWQKYEERTDLEALPGLPGVPTAENPAPDVGDVD